MIVINKIMISDYLKYVTKIRKQIAEGTGEIFDFKGWNEKRHAAFQLCMEELELSSTELKKIKIININEVQASVVKRILTKGRDLNKVNW